jgi:anti-sigma-K factor RskA
MYDDDRDALAAEYVLGTLSADEREQAEALLVIDPGFAEIVRLWERRLGELNVMVEAVEPPPDVWEKIQSEITGTQRRNAASVEAVLPAFEEAVTQTQPETEPETELAAAEEPAPGLSPDSEPETEPEYEPEPEPEPEHPEDLDDAAAVAALASSLLPPEPPPQAGKPKLAMPVPLPPPRVERGIQRSAEVIYLARQARRWRGFTVAMSALAAVLALFIVVSQLAPGLIPLPRQPQVAAAPPLPAGSQLVAVLQQEPTAPAFLLTVDPQNRTMTVRRLTAAADPGRSYELWLIAGNNPSPHSLGLVGADEFTMRPLPASFDADAMRAASYAVSLEPAGGSPSGVPTGPILFTGKMVQSVAGSPS